VKHVLPLHGLKNGEEYHLGIFLVGAYQDTIGIMHNMFGDTNVVQVRIGADGEIEYREEIPGDRVEEILSYAEYRPPEIMRRIRRKTESAARRHGMQPDEIRAALDAFRAGMKGYTYFEP
jgi:arginine decarboxylase